MLQNRLYHRYLFPRFVNNYNDIQQRFQTPIRFIELQSNYSIKYHLSLQKYKIIRGIKQSEQYTTCINQSHHVYSEQLIKIEYSLQMIRLFIHYHSLLNLNKKVLEKWLSRFLQYRNQVCEEYSIHINEVIKQMIKK